MRYKNLDKIARLTEDQLQIAVMQLANTHYILRRYLLHVPNGGYRHPAEAAKLKKMGVKKGVPDLFLPVPNDLYHGLFIELKVHPNKPTPEQVEFLADLTAFGYKTAVVYDDPTHAYKIMRDYLDNNF